MKALIVDNKTSRGNRRRKPAQAAAGMTFIEVMVSLAVIFLVGAGVLMSLTRIEQVSFVGRLQTLAKTSALNQMELIETDQPYSPNDHQIPSHLAIGTVATPIVLYSDPTNTAAPQINATLTTEIGDAGLSQNDNLLNVRTVRVTVSYTFRNANYSVELRTMRSPDV